MAKDVEVRKEREKEQVRFIRPFCFICEEEADTRNHQSSSLDKN